MDRSEQDMAVKIRHHAVKLGQYFEKHVGNSALAMATLTIVIKELIAKARRKNGDAYAQNLVQGFLGEFQAGGWVPITGDAQLKAINKTTAGVVYMDTGVIGLEGKRIMGNGYYVEANDSLIQGGDQQIRVPCFYHPCLPLPEVEDAPVPE